MRLTTDRLGTLLTYGLTEYQARVYLSLLEFPSLAAGALSKASHVPRNRLYEVLEELHSVGLVEIELDEPRKYRARPFQVYLERRASDLRAQIQEIESRKDSIAAAFQAPPAANGSDLESGTTRVLVGRRAVSRELERMIENARESLLVAASVGGSDRVVRHLASFGERFADEGGPSIEIYLPRATALTGGAERLGEPLFQSVRWLHVELRSLVAVADGHELLLSHPIPDDSRLHTGRDFGILTTNPAWVRDHAQLLRASARPPEPERVAATPIRTG